MSSLPGLGPVSSLTLCFDTCVWVWYPFQASALASTLTLTLGVNGTGINQCEPSKRQC